MDGPAGNAAALVQGLLGYVPISVTATTSTDQGIILPLLANNLPCQRRQAQGMLAFILGALGRKFPGSLVTVQLAPSHTANFIAALARENQQSDDAIVLGV